MLPVIAYRGGTCPQLPGTVRLTSPAEFIICENFIPSNCNNLTINNLRTGDSEKPTNVLEAMAGGAGAGMQLALSVGCDVNRICGVNRFN